MANAKILVNRNGPYLIQGDFEICDPAGGTFGLGGRAMVSLCRCGQSANKPFCDGTHAKVGFTHEPVARDLPPKA
jgi:CDGSH-type Zn-finger protein